MSELQQLIDGDKSRTIRIAKVFPLRLNGFSILNGNEVDSRIVQRRPGWCVVGHRFTGSAKSATTSHRYWLQQRWSPEAEKGE